MRVYLCSQILLPKNTEKTYRITAPVGFKILNTLHFLNSAASQGRISMSKPDIPLPPFDEVNPMDQPLGYTPEFGVTHEEADQNGNFRPTSEAWVWTVIRDGGGLSPDYIVLGLVCEAPEGAGTNWNFWHRDYPYEDVTPG